MQKIAFIEIGEKISINWCPNLIYALAKSDLEKKGHSCDILRVSKEDILENKKIFCDLLDFIKNKGYSLIGIQSSISGFVTGHIKSYSPKSKILFGGSNSIASIDKKDYDFLIHGPARESILKLVEYLDGKEKIEKIPNLFYRREGKILHSGKIKEFNLEEELKDFFPNFNRINFGVMINSKIETANIVSALGCPYQKSYTENNFYKDVKIEYDLIEGLDRTAAVVIRDYYNKIGKGCSFCNICSDRGYKTLPFDRLIPFLVNQVKYLTENYASIKRIQINDENSFRYLDLFFKELLNNKIRPVEFMVGGRADFFIGNIDKIERALNIIKGSVYILNIACIGFENFSQKELDIYNKGITVEQNIKALQELDIFGREFPDNFIYKKDRDHGFILFNPWTTIQDLKTNLFFIEKYNLIELMDPNRPLASSLNTYLYTPIYYKAKKEGLIVGGEEGLRYNTIKWTFSEKITEEIFNMLIQYCNCKESLQKQVQLLRKCIRKVERKDEEFIENNKHPFFIYIGEYCNNNCYFCTDFEVMISKSFEDIKKEILQAKGKFRDINFMGKEPALRKDIFKIIRFSKDNGINSVSITTNGRILSYKKFCISLSKSGIDWVGISIHGPTPQVHDRITQAEDSFNQTMEGIKNLYLFKIPFMINVVVVQENINRLEDIVRMLIPYAPSKINFLFCLPTYKAKSKEFIPKATEATDKIKRLIDKYHRIKIGTVGFPFCLMKGYEEKAAQCTESSHRTIHLPECKKCRYDCGVYEDYINIYGKNEFCRV